MTLIQQFSDDFTYTDGTLVSNASWEQHNTSATVHWDVVSNAALYTSPGDRDSAQVAGVAHADDQYAKATAIFSTAKAASLSAGLGLRMQPQRTTEDMYRVILVEGSSTDFFKVQVAKYVAGSGTNLALSTSEWSAASGNSYVLEGRIEGTEITAFVDGTQVTFDVGSSVTVTDFASGVPGLTAFRNDDATFDNFESGDITSGITGSGSHQATAATHSASGDVGTLQVSLDLVDVSNTAAPNNTGITAVVYDAAGGAEIYETATASITSGTTVISLPSGTTANNGDDVFVTLHKAGASFNDDLNGAGRATVTIA